MRKYKQELELPFPPSVNQCYRSIPRGKICTSILSKRGREYKERVGNLLEGDSKLLTDKKLLVNIKLFMPDRRRRDIDNYTKALLDALTGLVWEDDSQIDILVLSREPVEKGGRVKLTVQEL